ncbi:MAG: NAD(+)/NADH kinase [DPANN group archaeon]|nr:NAD(+)/NADH kinase [DPANN group archaeon]
MRYSIVGKDFVICSDMDKLLIDSGFICDNDNPEVVFSCGGDGAILVSERLYPGIPKVTIRYSDMGHKCVFDKADIENVIECIKNNDYKIREYIKLEAVCDGEKGVASNEVQVHNKRPTRAVRFNVYVNGKILYDNVVGDGIVISTPFGASAYYRSVGGKQFDKGIGIALNNPVDKKSSMVVSDSSVIEIEMLREVGQVFCDNHCEGMMLLAPGKKVFIKKSEGTAKFIV